MEETKWLTKTKIIIMASLVLIIGLIVIFIVVHRHNLKKEYIKYESQLEYAAPNYLLKEKIFLKENEWREIKVKDILKQKLITNKRSSDCDGYVIAQGLPDNTKTKENEKYTSNITYKAYIKCKKIYITEDYGSKKVTGKKNTEKTQSQSDTEKPKITLFGKSKMTLYVGDKYEEKGAMAIDNIDEDLTDFIKISGKVDTTKVGKYKIRYTVIDSSNNKAVATRLVVVKEKDSNSKTKTSNKDTTKPQIEFNNQSAYQRICLGSKVDISINGPYAYVARDDVDGDLTSKVNITGATNVINTIGTYSLTYEVSDKAGNKTTMQKNFDVVSCQSEAPKTIVTPTKPSTPVTPTPTPTPQQPVTPTVPPTTTVVPVSTVSCTTLSIAVGSTGKLSTTITPGNATNKTLSYSSSNSNIASIDSTGTVKGVSKGTATITITSNNGKKGVCSVIVQ